MPNPNPVQIQGEDAVAAPHAIGTEANSDSLYGLPSHLRVKQGSSWIPATDTMLQRAPFASIVAHGQDASVTTTPEQLPTHAGAGVLLEAPSSNTDTVLWGNSGNQYHEIPPGERVYLEVTNSNLLYIKSVSGTQKLTYTVFNV